MKKNFSDFELHLVSKVLGPQFNVRFNKCGNITVKHVASSQDFWTLYYVNHNYIWRRHNEHGDCYPLHMINRHQIGPIQKYVSCGKTYYFYQREFDIKWCEFYSFNNALEYFVNYLNKYRHIKV